MLLGRANAIAVEGTILLIELRRLDRKRLPMERLAKVQVRNERNVVADLVDKGDFREAALNLRAYASSSCGYVSYQELVELPDICILRDLDDCECRIALHAKRFHVAR